MNGAVAIGMTALAWSLFARHVEFELRARAANDNRHDYFGGGAA